MFDKRSSIEHYTNLLVVVEYSNFGSITIGAKVVRTSSGGMLLL